MVGFWNLTYPLPKVILKFLSCRERLVSFHKRRTMTSIVALCQMENNQESDFFAFLAEKEPLKTKEGKPYLRVAFRDASRTVRFPIWSDVPIYKEFQALKPGTFCKLRAMYRITSFGPQLDIRQIREANSDDKKDGFDPHLLRPVSSLPLESMFNEILNIAAKQLGKGPLLNLVTKIFKENRDALLVGVAARQHHHTFCGGLLEHTLSVTKIAVALVDHYHTMYAEYKKEISRPLVVAGAILHDIGKVREFGHNTASPRHSVEGELIGHSLLGRDMVREAAQGFDIPSSTRTHLEHIIISHQRFADWGAPKPPMSLEAMLVHHADSCDALVGCFRNAFGQDDSEFELTSKKNVVGYPLLKPKHNV